MIRGPALKYLNLLLVVFTFALWHPATGTSKAGNATSTADPSEPKSPTEISGRMENETIGTAGVQLPAAIGDNMVLQSGMPVPIWGWAKAGRQVTVCFAGQTKRTVADMEGRWMIKLDPLEANQKPRRMDITALFLSIYFQ